MLAILKKSSLKIKSIREGNFTDGLVSIGTVYEREIAFSLNMGATSWFFVE